MMHSAYNAADTVENNIQIDNPGGSRDAYNAKENKNVGHHYRCEKFEKILNPKMHDPEPPKIHHREISFLSKYHSGGIEKRNR